MDLFSPSMKVKGWVLVSELLMRTRRVKGWNEGVYLQRGQAQYGEKALAERCSLTRQTTRTCINVLKKSGIATTETTSYGSILTWRNYSLLCGQDVEDQPTNQPTSNQRATNEQPHKKGSYTCVNAKETDGVPSEFAAKAFDYWNGKSKLGSSKAQQLKALDKLLREVGDEPMAQRIIEYAVESQIPAGIPMSPLTLVRPRKGDEKSWEKIRTQLTGKVSKPQVPSETLRAVKIVEAHNGQPVTDPATRLKRILSWAPKVTSDPDQGYPFTLPDSAFQEGCQ